MNNNYVMAWYVIPLVLALATPLTRAEPERACPPKELKEYPSSKKDIVEWSGTCLAQIGKTPQREDWQREQIEQLTDVKWRPKSPVAISPDAKLMLVVKPSKASKSKLTLEMWDLETGGSKTLTSTQAFDGEVQALAFSGDSNHVVAAIKEKKKWVHLWYWKRNKDKKFSQSNMAELKKVKTIHSLAVSSDGERALAAGSSRNPDNVLWLWKTDSTDPVCFGGTRSRQAAAVAGGTPSFLGADWRTVVLENQTEVGGDRRGFCPRRCARAVWRQGQNRQALESE